MKLLFDEHLSPRLATLLADVFPGSANVLTIGLGGAADEEVQAYALQNSFALVSKDSDFVDRVVASNGPKLIRITLGNTTTERVHTLLRNSYEGLLGFAASDDLIIELP